MFTMKVDDEVELQLFQLHHSEELFQLLTENRNHLRKWLPWVDHLLFPDQCLFAISTWLKQFAENNSFTAGIRYKQKLVGSIHISLIDWENKQTSIGYFLGEKAQGKGIITRSVKTLLNHCFFDLCLNRVEIRCSEKNWRSRKIPEKLGFTLEGVLRQGEKLRGDFHNIVIYSMLANDWLRQFS